MKSLIVVFCSLFSTIIAESADTYLGDNFLRDPLFKESTVSGFGIIEVNSDSILKNKGVLRFSNHLAHFTVKVAHLIEVSPSDGKGGKLIEYLIRNIDVEIDEDEIPEELYQPFHFAKVSAFEKGFIDIKKRISGQFVSRYFKSMFSFPVGSVNDQSFNEVYVFAFEDGTIFFQAFESYVCSFPIIEPMELPESLRLKGFPN